jgi:hypothetical protein
VTPATRLKAKLRALSQRERFLLSLCAGFVLLFALVRWGVYPAVESWRKTRDAIPRQLETLTRHRLAAQGEEKIDEAFADAAGRLEELEEGVLPGENPAAAGSALQGILKPWVERPDTRLTSVRTLAPVQKGPYAEVAVQIDLQTTTEGLAKLLAEIPRHPQILRVRKLSVHSGYYGAAMVNRRESLAASVVVAGIADSDVGAKVERDEE